MANTAEQGKERRVYQEKMKEKYAQEALAHLEACEQEMMNLSSTDQLSVTERWLIDTVRGNPRINHDAFQSMFETATREERVDDRVFTRLNAFILARDEERRIRERESRGVNVVNEISIGSVHQERMRQEANPHIEVRDTGGINLNATGGGSSGGATRESAPASVPAPREPARQPQEAPAAAPQPREETAPVVTPPPVQEVAPVVVVPPPPEAVPVVVVPPPPAPQMETNFLRHLNTAKREETLREGLDGVARTETQIVEDLKKVKYAEIDVVKADRDLNPKIDQLITEIAKANDQIEKIPPAKLQELADVMGLPVETIKEMAAAQFAKMTAEADKTIKSQTTKGGLKKAIVTQTVLYAGVATLGIVGLLPATLVGVGVGVGRLAYTAWQRRKERKKIEAEKDRVAVEMVKAGTDENKRYKESLWSGLSSAKQEQINGSSFEQTVTRMDEKRADYIRDYQTRQGWMDAPPMQDAARDVCLTNIYDARVKYETRIKRYLLDHPYWGQASVDPEERELYAAACGDLFAGDERKTLTEMELEAEFNHVDPGRMGKVKDLIEQKLSWVRETKFYTGLQKRAKDQLTTGAIMVGGRLIAHSNSVLGVAMDAYGGWRLGGAASDFILKKKYRELQRVTMDDIKKCESIVNLPDDVAAKLEVPNIANRTAWLQELHGKAEQQVMDPKFKKENPTEYAQLKEYLRDQEVKNHGQRYLEQLKKVHDEAEQGLNISLTVAGGTFAEAQKTRERVVAAHEAAQDSRERQRELAEKTRKTRVLLKVGGALFAVVAGEMMAGRVSEVLGREMEPESPVPGVDALHRGGAKVPHIIPEGVMKSAAEFVANVQEHTKGMVGFRWWERLPADFWKENIDWMKKFVPELELAKAPVVMPVEYGRDTLAMPTGYSTPSASTPPRLPEDYYIESEKTPLTGPSPKPSSPLPNTLTPAETITPPSVDFREITHERNSITAALAEMLESKGMGHNAALAEAGDIALKHGDIHVFDLKSGDALTMEEVMKMREGGMSWKQIYNTCKIEETYEMKVGGKIYLTGDKEHGWSYQEQHGSEALHGGGTVEKDWEKLHTRLPQVDDAAAGRPSSGTGTHIGSQYEPSAPHRGIGGVGIPPAESTIVPPHFESSPIPTEFGVSSPALGKLGDALGEQWNGNDTIAQHAGSLAGKDWDRLVPEGMSAKSIGGEIDHLEDVRDGVREMKKLYGGYLNDADLPDETRSQFENYTQGLDEMERRVEDAIDNAEAFRDSVKGGVKMIEEFGGKVRYGKDGITIEWKDGKVPAADQLEGIRRQLPESSAERSAVWKLMGGTSTPAAPAPVPLGGVGQPVPAAEQAASSGGGRPAGANTGAIREVQPGVHEYDPKKGPLTSKEFIGEVFGGDTAGTTRHELMVDGQKLTLKVDSEGNYLGPDTGRDVSYVTDAQAEEMLNSDYRVRIAQAHPEFTNPEVNDMAHRAELSATGMYDSLKIYKTAVAAGDQRLADSIRNSILSELERAEEYHGRGVMDVSGIKQELGMTVTNTGAAETPVPAAETSPGGTAPLPAPELQPKDALSTLNTSDRAALTSHVRGLVADMLKPGSPIEELATSVGMGTDEVKAMLTNLQAELVKQGQEHDMVSTLRTMVEKFPQQAKAFGTMFAGEIKAFQESGTPIPQGSREVIDYLLKSLPQ